MLQITKKSKSLVTDFIIYTIILGAMAFFTNLKDLEFTARLLKCLLHGAGGALLLVLLKAILFNYGKRKIIYTFCRSTPEEIETCKEILMNKRWKNLTDDEKETINEIIDKTAYKYSY